VHTDVIDFGPGVSEGNRDKIFTRFFTQRPEGQPRGTGLGLSIVQAVAEAHGGEVSLRPADPARGACFRLTSW
jgi:signal transduction histidine kinase